jgi:low temperature requirement protein LtrA
MLLMEGSGFRISPGHFSERHGLIFIVALGEAVISIGVGASGLEINEGVLVPAALGLGVIVAMWWTYFDVNALAAARHLTMVAGKDRAIMAREAYTTLHLPMIIGAIFFSLGVEMTLAHTNEALHTIPAAALCGGLSLYLLAQIGFRLRCGGSLAIPRVIAVLTLTGIFAVSEQFIALAVFSAVAICFAVLVAYETVGERESRRYIRSHEDATWSQAIAGTTYWVEGVSVETGRMWHKRFPLPTHKLGDSQGIRQHR